MQDATLTPKGGCSRSVVSTIHFDVTLASISAVAIECLLFRAELIHSDRNKSQHTASCQVGVSLKYGV